MAVRPARPLPELQWITTTWSGDAGQIKKGEDIVDIGLDEWIMQWETNFDRISWAEV